MPSQLDYSAVPALCKATRFTGTALCSGRVRERNIAKIDLRHPARLSSSKAGTATGNAFGAWVDNRGVNPLGISLHELKGYIGRELAVTDWLPITQERVRQFADATGDPQWIHLDQARAVKESPYGGTIAHGFLTLSLLSQFIKQALDIQGLRMAINYGLNRVRFPAAVKAGGSIRARFTLLSVKDLDAGVEVVYQATLQADDGGEKPCCVAEWVVRYYAL